MRKFLRKVFRTGTVAREFEVSRERVLEMIDAIGLQPLRDDRGNRILTDRDLKRLRAFRRQRQRARAGV